MKTLVVGGAGYVGSHILGPLLRAGHEPIVFDNLSKGHRQAVGELPLVVGDLADGDALRRTLADHRIEAVMHFAAHCYVGESVTDPAKYYRNNVAGTLSLLEAMRDAGVWRIVFSSTCATYGEPAAQPISEALPQQPINPYGFTKLVIERALADFAAAYGFGYAALRYFNAAGADPDGRIGEDHDPETHLIPIVAQAALGRRSHVEIFGDDYPTPDGTCIRDYVHVLDLAEVHIRCLQRLQPGGAMAYNVGTGRGYSVREVVQAVERVSGRSVQTRIGPRRAGDPPELVADPGKIRRELGWRPRFDTLAAIVETAWRWHQSHPDGYRSPES